MPDSADPQGPEDTSDAVDVSRDSSDERAARRAAPVPTEPSPPPTEHLDPDRAGPYPTAGPATSPVEVGRPDALVELAVAGVELSSTWADPPTATVGLEPVAGGPRIEIVMSRVDGQFLNEALAVGPPPRPRSHDLLLDAVRALNGEVTAATLTEKRAGGLYVAELSIRRPDGSTARLDARPSDAINVALRSPSAALWADPSVLDPNAQAPGVSVPWSADASGSVPVPGAEIVLSSSTDASAPADPPVDAPAEASSSSTDADAAAGPEAGVPERSTRDRPDLSAPEDPADRPERS